MGKIKHISLFNGIGGFQLAAHWAGWENVAHCEIDEWCNKVVAQHFPNSKCYTDIKQFNANEYRNSINVISGGFPCQPFSLAGKQRGKEDDRYLWPEMLRIIREVKPQIVIGENVAGIVDLALDTVLSDLESEGYKTEAFIIPACAINAPHRRDRVWIIAYTEHWWNGWWQQQPEGEQKTTELNENTDSFRCNSKEWESKSEIRGFGKFGTGNNERIYSEQITTNTESTGQQMCENGQRKEQLRGSATRDIWQEWTTEPPICGMDNGIPKKLDKNLIEYEKSNYKKTFTEVDFVRWQILQNVWNNRKFTKASPRLQFRGSENSLSKVPYFYSLEGEELGKRIEENKELCNLWERVYSKPLKETQDLQLEMLIRIREIECSKEMEKRVDRIKALGNAIVPQVAYEIMNSLNLIAAQAAKERGAVFNNFQAELSNGNEM